MRFFGRCKYNGTTFHGWQSQKNDPLTIQYQIENALSMVLRNPTPIVGCGRTDAGVHSSEYFFHFDAEIEVDYLETLLFKANSILPFTIVINRFYQVADDAHARYDATRRAYTYYVVNQRDPFRQHTTFFYANCQKIDVDLLQKAAQLLLNFEDFTPFCKSGSNVKHKRCTIYKSEWKQTETGFIYHVEANRFLRGMIRLIVGMCINVAIGKIRIIEVEEALKDQQRLTLDWSVPATGLFLSKIDYEYIND